MICLLCCTSGLTRLTLDDQSIAIATIRAALTLAATQPTFVDVVRGAIRYRGDTDSVAAVAVAIMAPRHLEALPDFFERGLELGSPKTGTVRLRPLGKAPMSRFGGEESSLYPQDRVFFDHFFAKPSQLLDKRWFFC